MTKILNVVKKNMVMSNIRNLPNSKNVFTILTVLVCMGYAALLSNKTMPYAEGWYTYYAQCINQGQVVYKDFDYLFPPVYIYFIALFTKIFGYKIIALRILGVIVFGCIGGLVYNILSEVFENKIAFISSISATFFLQSEVVQIFYDYVRVMDIFSCLSILFLVKFVKSDNQNKQYKYLVFAGVACSLFILIKQNMGIVFSAYAIILIIAVCIAKRNIIKEIFLKLLLYAGGGSSHRWLLHAQF